MKKYINRYLFAQFIYLVFFVYLDFDEDDNTFGLFTHIGKFYRQEIDTTYFTISIIAIPLILFLIIQVFFLLFSTKSTEKKSDDEQKVSKVGLLGTLLGAIAYSKANKVGNPPIVIARGNDGKVNGVNHVSGNEYRVYVQWFDGNRWRDDTFEVRPGIRSQSFGNVSFDVRWS